jgi:VWFA-related protein
LLIDDLTLSAEGLNRTRRALLTFVDKHLDPTDQVVISLASGALEGTVASPTSDRAALANAVKGLRLRSGRFRSVESLETIHDYRMYLMTRKFEGRREALLAAGALESLRSMLARLEEVEGRRVVLLLSEGLRVDPEGELSQAEADPGSFSLRRMLGSVTDDANRASIVIYAMDARGLQTLTFGADDALGPPILGGAGGGSLGRG